MLVFFLAAAFRERTAQFRCRAFLHKQNEAEICKINRADGGKKGKPYVLRKEAYHGHAASRDGRGGNAKGGKRAENRG